MAADGRGDYPETDLEFFEKSNYFGDEFYLFIWLFYLVKNLKMTKNIFLKKRSCLFLGIKIQIKN